MKTQASLRVAAALLAGALTLGVGDAHAFRMIQNPNAVRTSTGTPVTCTDPLGFAHRTVANVNWVMNPANQGGKSGVPAAFQNALAAWNGVTAAGYTLAWTGTTNAGFATDGLNTVSWGQASGCTGGCLALTALVLGPGQAILESDISFNDGVTWNTNGTDYDVQAIATHELGHSMGIHHTDLTKKRPRPTMYAAYFGTDARTLEDDDRAALTCAHDRYPPSINALAAVNYPSNSPQVIPLSARLTARTRPGAATLRFDLEHAGSVRLDVFDLAGRKLATLMDGVRDAGEYELAWNGATESGRAQPGMYFARVITARGEAHASVLLAE